jgi:hypothetical protein
MQFQMQPETIPFIFAISQWLKIVSAQSIDMQSGAGLRTEYGAERGEEIGFGIDPI